MKRFRIHDVDEAGYKAVIVMLLLIAALIFSGPTSTGFVVYKMQDELLSTASENGDVKAFTERNPHYTVNTLFLDVQEIEYLGRKYPALYASLPRPLYEIRLETDKEGMLILMSDREVYRTFEYML